MTGKEIARADWVERGDPARWGDPRGNRVNRNQIGAAKLDGKRHEHSRRARHVHVDVRRCVESGRRQAGQDVAVVRRRHDAAGSRARRARDARLRLRRRRPRRSRARVGDDRRQRQDAVDQPPRAPRCVLRGRHHSRTAGPRDRVRLRRSPEDQRHPGRRRAHRAR